MSKQGSTAAVTIVAVVAAVIFVVWLERAEIMAWLLAMHGRR